ncbi:MAG TPA: PH domain-containing protein [Allosphingosinicella sp.]|nr:PH domain-containing protein [Allosphingosinicella sp.]
MDERLDTFRSSTLGWLIGTAAGIGTILLGLAGIVLLALETAGIATWWLGLTVLALVIVLVKWVQNLAASFAITEERLIIRRGIIFKSVDEIELYRIKDVRIDFSLLNQIAGIGRITISSSDETTRDGDLVIPEIQKAQERREHLRRLVDTARQKRRVREIDMVHEDI